MSNQPPAQIIPQHFASCQCCVDSRLTGPDDVGIFAPRTIAASFSDHRNPLSAEAIHTIRLIEFAAMYSVSATIMVEGHYDCKAIIDIWKSRHLALSELQDWLRDLREPYEPLIRQVANVMGEDYSEDEQRRVFNIVKVLFDYRRAMNLHEISSAVKAGAVHVVCTFEDLAEVSPDKWVAGSRYLFSPMLQTFIETNLTRTELNTRAGLAEYYAVSKHPLNIAVVIENILTDTPELIHAREPGKPFAKRPANENRLEARFQVGSAGQGTVRDTKLHHT